MASDGNVDANTIGETVKNTLLPPPSAGGRILKPPCFPLRSGPVETLDLVFSFDNGVCLVHCSTRTDVKAPKIPSPIALVEALERDPMGASYLIVLVALLGVFSFLVVHR